MFCFVTQRDIEKKMYVFQIGLPDKIGSLVTSLVNDEKPKLKHYDQ